jgi:mRNA-degrading endonuclease RelE of RelBE toxin-antitoxin system
VLAVRITPEAERDLKALPVTIKARLLGVVDRLDRWPQVSGAKALSYDWAGHFRVRTGDWRVIFRADGNDVTIVRIMHRSKVYGD